jgi:GNAT superfamily N-acetyltransferase
MTAERVAMPGPGAQEPRPIYRAARPVDAPAVSALYDAEYRPPGGGDARDNYPFPQFLEPDWVASAVGRDEICWIVAELDGRVVGSAGAMRNIGTPADRVAEVFGIVVDHEVRGRKIGCGLLHYLYETLADQVEVTLCEARTGDARGWKVARSAGFHPIGFEPFAHATPVGSESMLLTARESRGADRNTAAIYATDAVRDLVRAVHQCNIGDNGRSTRLKRRIPLPPWPTSPEGVAAELVRDDEFGASVLSRWRDRLRHRSGVVDLLRIEGVDSSGRPRYDCRHYLLRQGDQVLACSRIVWDHRDCRARILSLQSEFEGARDPLLEGVINSLALEAGEGPFVIVIDIRADTPELQVRLEAMGFIPTACYPGLIAAERGRIDAFQYTLLDRRPIAESLRCVDRLDWGAARAVVARVVRLARSNRRVRSSDETQSALPIGVDR